MSKKLSLLTVSTEVVIHVIQILVEELQQLPVALTKHKAHSYNHPNHL